MTTAQDLLNGRNGSHRYNITPKPAEPEPRLKKNGELHKIQPKLADPKFDTTGVTTISGMLEKDGLVWGASKETALLAVHGKDQWEHLPEEEAVDKLRTHFRRVWDLKSETGTIVHQVALDWAQERESDLDHLLTFDENGKERDWRQDERAEVLRRVDGCLSALELFYLEQRPKWHHVEQTVIHPGVHFRHGDPYTRDEYRIDRVTAFAGCLDATGELAQEGDVLLDFKTGQRYLDSIVLQLAGYANAKLRGIYDEVGHLIGVEEFHAPKKRVVVFLNDTGEYELLELPVNRAAYQRYIGLKRTHAWLSEFRAWERQHPAPVLVDLDSDLDTGEIDMGTVPANISSEETAA